MSLLLIIALAAQAAPSRPPVDTKLGVAEPVNCVTTPRALGCPERRSDRYRLTDADEPAFDHKADGLKQDGRECGLVGPQYCTGKPRTILATQPQ